MYNIIILFVVAFTSFTVASQELDPTGTWEKVGTPMGEDGTGWILPHKQSASNCGKDHSVFFADQTGQEVTYKEPCESKVRTFNWRLEGNLLTLSRGDRYVIWQIKSIEDDTMVVGIAPKPGSENLMYAVYKKKNNP
ncbi:lipocalin family protein [Bizionia sp.]|uniref:lipocalin family protein n=1 Tax=Bizionia sp. TaxID=1954480 RepID=UPI003A8D8C78